MLDGRGITTEDLLEFGVWIVMLLVEGRDGDEQYVSEVPVCARDIEGADSAARAWTVKDGMEPVRTIQSRYVCGVKAIDISIWENQLNAASSSEMDG